MGEDRDRIIDFLNICENCYSAVLKSNHKPEVKFVKFKRVFQNIIILGVDNREIKYFDCTENNNISVAIWSRIKGYQLKCIKISKDDEGKYRSEIDEFKNSLKENKIELTNMTLILYHINNIYSVTPGKHAGELVNY